MPRFAFTKVRNEPKRAGRLLTSDSGFILSVTSNSLVSHLIRPLDSQDYEVTPRVATEDERVTAVVIQGPANKISPSKPSKYIKKYSRKALLLLVPGVTKASKI